jgi:hypothetical protein
VAFGCSLDRDALWFGHRKAHDQPGARSQQRTGLSIYYLIRQYIGGSRILALAEALGRDGAPITRRVVAMSASA